jgi:uncharacterized repeat protein (TIGR03803 family)
VLRLGTALIARLAARRRSSRNTDKRRLVHRTYLVAVLCAMTSISAYGQNFTTLDSFNGADGSFSVSALVQATDGNFYGTTVQGGSGTQCSGGCGTIFKINSAGTLTTIYNFCLSSKCPDGSAPYGKLMQGDDGNFYGTTSNGGSRAGCSSGCGTIFKIAPGGTLTTPLHLLLPNSVLGWDRPLRYFWADARRGRELVRDYGSRRSQLCRLRNGVQGEPRGDADDAIHFLLPASLCRRLQS